MSKILNVILCVILVFLLTFCWIYFSLRSVNAAWLLAAVVALAMGYVLWQANTKLEQNKQIKQKRKNDVASLAQYLEFNEDNGKLVGDLLTYYDFEVKSRSYDNLVASKNGADCYVAMNFAQATVGKDFIRQNVVLAKRSKATKLYVFCNKCASDLQSLANEHIATVFVDINNLYLLLEQSGKMPAFTPKKAKKASFVASYALSRKRFGWYFFSSVFCLAISLISYLRYYLLVWSTVFFVLSAYALCNKRFNSVPTNVTLD